MVNDNYYAINNVRFRPIVTWPGERTAQRVTSKFRATWTDTMKLLKRELEHLGAKEVVLELDMPEADIRNDGYPRRDARARSPGVILSVDTRHGWIRYPCDNYKDWESNVRAIALSLEDLRAVDRHGVAKRGEQYAGWKALPGAGGTSSTMELTTAAAIVCYAAGLTGLLVTAREVLADRSAYIQAYRAAAKRLHPDHGGSDREFAELGEAKRALERHHQAGA